MSTNRILLCAALLLAGCASQAPEQAPASQPQLVVLGTYEGEIDPVAGTFTIRTHGPQSTPGESDPNLTVIVDGSSTVTIANNGAVTGPVDGTGACAGQQVMSGTVRITLRYPSPGFAGGLYSENTWVSASGSEACNSDAAPAGLSATYGLWSYGEVRPGSTTSDKTWQFKWASGQKVSFRGRIVGVPGTTFATSTDLPLAFSNSDFRNPIIAYNRGQMAYASNGGKIVYVNLDGTYSTALSLPGSESANSLAFYTGATAADDLLWFTTNSYVGVVHGGSVYSVAGGTAPLASVAVDPETQNRAWFISRGGTYIRPVDFNTSTHAFTLGSTSATTRAGYSLAIGAATSPATGNRIYVTSNLFAGGEGGNGWIKIFTLAGAADGSLDPTGANCGIPFGITLAPDGKLWWTACQGGCAFCGYDPTDGTYQRFAPVYSASAVCFAKSATSSSTVPWGIDIDPSRNPAVSNMTQLVAGTGSARISVDFLDSQWPNNVASAAGSPVVTVSGTDYPAYLWVTTGNGLVRLQP